MGRRVLQPKLLGGIDDRDRSVDLPWVHRGLGAAFGREVNTRIKDRLTGVIEDKRFVFGWSYSKSLQIGLIVFNFCWVLLLVPAVGPWLVLLGVIFSGVVLMPLMLIRRGSTAVLECLILIGVCPQCGYDLGSLRPEADGCTVCPECGAAWRLGDGGSCE